MRNAKRAGNIPCTAKSPVGACATTGDSENLKAAYLASPVGPGFREQIRRARALTPAYGLRKAARVAVAASMLLAGRGTGASS
jgi:hypothetical protein